MKACILYFISFDFNDAKLKLRRNMVNLREEAFNPLNPTSDRDRISPSTICMISSR